MPKGNFAPALRWLFTILFLVVSRRARHERTSFAISLAFCYSGFGTCANHRIGYYLCAFVDTACNFGDNSVRDTYADRMCSECVTFTSPDFMFTFAIFNHCIRSYQWNGRRKAQRFCRTLSTHLFIQSVDSDVCRQPRFQFQIGLWAEMTTSYVTTVVVVVVLLELLVAPRRICVTFPSNTSFG